MADDRVSTGVPGLDEMLGGGIPRSHAVAVLGACGTGKTTLALQFLWRGLMDGENGMFITLEEDKTSIIKSAHAYGWDIDKFLDTRQMLVEKLDPSDAKASVARVNSELPSVIRSANARRVAFDSVSVLGMLYDDISDCRKNLFGLCKLIKASGATALYTAEVRDDNPLSSRDGLIEYAVDGVIVLRYKEPLGNEDVQQTVRVLKMRRTNHSKRIRPYVVTSKGIEVLNTEVF